MRILHPSRLAALLLTPLLLAQTPPEPKPAAATTASPAPAAPAKPLHVHVIGASVSGGFRDGPMTGAQRLNDTVTLQALLRPWCDEQGSVTIHKTPQMLLMFTNPQKIGTDQVEAAGKQEPDVLLAIDFPFWFAYGYVNGDEAEARRERLAKGLELLARFPVPVLIGDLPDMQGAAARMLNPRQIPSPELLGALNQQLRAFAKARPNWQVVPLAEAVRTMKHQGVTLPLREGPRPTPPGALLQDDHLHANRLGMAYLGHVLQPFLVAAVGQHPLAQRAFTFEQWVAAAGAEDELASLPAVEPPAKPADAGKH
jgi:hypothetical protein